MSNNHFISKTPIHADRPLKAYAHVADPTDDDDDGHDDDVDFNKYFAGKKAPTSACGITALSPPPHKQIQGAVPVFACV